ncbi:serine proteinase stubble [Halyomorpha halys]|uniref:serine proteinase stubble n=1 Tax=Halyomorpha halys TaxID=286706 RepID=UPI0006D50E8F|nr:serine proteinase stubble [Halyomorpha halys]
MLKALTTLSLAVLAAATPLWQPHLYHASVGRNIRHLPCVSRRTGEAGTCMFAISCAKANGTHLGTCIDRFYFGSCCKIPTEESPSDIDVVPPIEDNSLDATSAAGIRPAVTQKPLSTIASSSYRPSISTTIALPSSSHTSNFPSSTAASTLGMVESKPTTAPPTLVTWTTVEESSNKPSAAASIRPQVSVSASSAGTHRPVLSSTTETSTTPTKLPSVTVTHPGSTGRPSVFTTQRPPPSTARPPLVSQSSPQPSSTPQVVTTNPGSTPSIAPISSQRPPISTHRPVTVITLPSSTSTFRPSSQSTPEVNFQPVSTQRPPPTSTRPSYNTSQVSFSPPPSTFPSSSSSFRPPPSTVRPPSTSSRPPPSTSPSSQGTILPSSTSKPTTTTRPTPSTPRPPSSTARPPSSTARPPPSTGKPPSTAGRPPSTAARPPSTTSRPPSSTGKPPQGSQKPGSPRPPITSPKPKPTQRPPSKPGVKPKPKPTSKPPPKPIATTRPTPRPTASPNKTTTSAPISSTSQKPASETWVPVSVTTHAPSTSTPLSTDKTPSTSTTTNRPSTAQPTTPIASTNASSGTSAPTSQPTTPSTFLIDDLNMTNYKEVCGRRLFPESRVVGGDKSTFGKWPWQISLRQWRTSTYLHKCGAALLNENWAITAAHCVENVPPSDLLLRLGEHDLSVEDEPYGYQERRVQIVASHPQFDPRTFEYDLALLRFYEPVSFQPNIIPICVPEDDINFVGSTAYVTGWGRLYEDGPLPSVLQEVSVPVINNSLCETMYRAAGYIEHIPDIFICAGWKKGGFDSCEGDSGGPMVIQRPDRRWLLAGVISWGIGCAEPNQPGVYTRISQFRDWINQILQF